MLRVLVLSTLFPDASRPNFGIFVERQTLALGARPGVEVRVVAPIGLPPPPLDRLARYRALAALPACEQHKGLTVYRPRFLNLPGTAARFHARAIAASLTPLLRRIREDFPFDVITAEYFFPDGVAAVELGQRFGVPVSIQARGSDIHRWGHSRVVGPQILAASRAADRMLAVSDPMRRDMIALGMPEDRITTLVTGVDLDRFALADRAEAKAKLRISGPLILSIGALIPLKGHAILIDAMRSLPGAHLWIAGTGPEQARLAAQIQALGLGDRVRLLGSVAHDALPALLAATDVMALPSEREGLANAWLEALASGTPIVITDVGGARQVVTRPAAGRLVAREAGAIAAATSELLANPPPRAEVRACAEPFTWEANSAAHQALLQAAVDARRAGDGPA